MSYIIGETELKIVILCTYVDHPIYPHITKWKNENSKFHNIKIVNKSSEITEDGDILFLIASSEIIKDNIKSKFKKVLCVHESDLPRGKGWSPCVHLVLAGENKIPITLFEIIDKIDSGDIWKKTSFTLEGHELADEINYNVSQKTLELMTFAIENFHSIKPIPQEKDGESFYPKRNPEDSELDINKTILEQFNLMRIADQNRYPCFFYNKGLRYKLTLSKY